MIKKVYKKKKIKGVFLDKETGEVLDSNATSVNVIDNDKVIISYKEYVTVNYEAMTYLEGVMTEKQMGQVHKLVTMIKDSSNFLYQNNSEYHNEKTLAKEFDYAKSAFYKFINEQVRAGVIYEIRGRFGDKVQKRYILNPYLARKSKLTDKDSLQYFNNFKARL